MTDMQPIVESLRMRLNELETELKAETERCKQAMRVLRAEHRAKTERTEQEAKRIRAALRALEGRERANGRQTKGRRGVPRHVGVRKRNGTATGFGVTVEGIAPVVELILRLTREGRGTFTQRELYTALGWDQSKMSGAMRFLRSIEFVRMAGRDGAATQWAILDADAYDRTAREGLDVVEE